MTSTRSLSTCRFLLVGISSESSSKSPFIIILIDHHVVLLLFVVFIITVIAPKIEQILIILFKNAWNSGSVSAKLPCPACGP